MCSGQALFGVGGIWIPTPSEDSEVRGNPAPNGLVCWVWHNEDTAPFHISRVHEGAGFQVF